ncbi:MAG: DeoR/GlpR transcriptional regulator [Clostridiales bacterium]|nr:DeoR/GlpR transcriptional regulator [Clostridiales bacterium]MBO4580505.1 DeoR/GlpR transcriptional regulator [Clostridiales bacterium]
MVNTERRKKILDILETCGKISTVELGERLGVTGATVRSDIRDLERAGALVRYHGGVALPNASQAPSDFNYMVRSVSEVKLKTAIGRIAGGMVSDGDTIFMDASSTTFHMIKFMKDRSDVTVITNGLHTAMELQSLNSFKSVLVLGGTLRPHSGAIEGMSSREMIKRLSGKFYFVSGNGFSAETGLSGNNFYEIELKKLCAERSKHIVALVDSTKIGRDSSSGFIPTSRIGTLITDSGVLDDPVKRDVVDKCRKAGVEVMIAEV